MSIGILLVCCNPNKPHHGAARRTDWSFYHPFWKRNRGERRHGRPHSFGCAGRLPTRVAANSNGGSVRGSGCSDQLKGKTREALIVPWAQSKGRDCHTRPPRLPGQSWDTLPGTATNANVPRPFMFLVANGAVRFHETKKWSVLNSHRPFGRVNLFTWKRGANQGRPCREKMNC